MATAKLLLLKRKVPHWLMSNFSSLIRLVIIFGGALIFLRGLKFLRDRKSLEPEVEANENEEFPYVKKNVMSPTELKLFTRLVSAFPDYLLFSQVQLSRILISPSGIENSKWNNKINRMSLDFVICDKSSNPICVIELDDKSHDGESAKTRDAKKDKALAAAGIPITRIKVAEIPSVAQLPKLLGIVA